MATATLRSMMLAAATPPERATSARTTPSSTSVSYTHLDALNLRKGGTERILLEGQMMIRLDHPNIVRVLDISLHDGVPYLVFEYVSEMSLQDLIENIGRLPAERVAQVGAQVAAALAVTSSEGLLHRDVKPEQISSVGSVRNRSLHR